MGTNKIKMTKANALKEIKSLDDRKAELQAIINAESEKITDRIKTWPQVLKVYIANNGPLPEDLAAIIAYKGKDKRMIALQGIAQVDMIRDTYNEGWVPDWTNSKEYKWYPWFDMSSGSGLACNGYGYAYAYSDSIVGSRLCYKSREIAEAAGKNFTSIYTKFFTL